MWKFQSLLHQGISLLVGIVANLGIAIDHVSIPSSSGHQFTEGYGQMVDRDLLPFQSLLHQGISLLRALRARHGAG